MGGACGICGSELSTSWLNRREWNYRACSTCGAVWLDPLPADGWAEAYYDRSYFAGGRQGGYLDYLADEIQHRVNGQARVALASRFGASPPGMWLDVGCAAGFTLVEAHKAGFSVLGVEPSGWARDVARQRFGLKVARTLREARDEHAGQVDVVSLFQVLEHLRDPIAALRDARACLRPNGLLILETWDRSSRVARLFGRYWQQIAPPSVLWLFDRKSIAHSLARTGFRPPEIEPTSKRVNLSWVLGSLAEKAPRALGTGLRAVGRSGLQRVGITYGLGDLISVAAMARPDDH